MPVSITPEYLVAWDRDLTRSNVRVKPSLTQPDNAWRLMTRPNMPEIVNLLKKTPTIGGVDG